MKKKASIVIGIVVVLIIGIALALIDHTDSSPDVIGGGDGPTDIWIGEEEKDE